MIPFLDKNLIGVDVGMYSMKVVKLKGGPGAYTLTAAACVKLPKDVLDNRTLASGFLAEVIRAKRVSGKRAATILAGSSLAFRHMYLPVMPEKDLREAIRWEIRKEIAFPASELVCDYVVSGIASQAAGKGEGAKNQMSLTVFAALKKDVESLIALFNGAGLDLRVVEVAPTALLSVFDMNNDWDEHNYAMLDIGDTSSILAIFKDRRLEFARELGYGGADITNAAALALNKDQDEAQEYKHTYGLSQKDGFDKEARKAITASIEGLCSEIHRSFDYYQAQYRGGSISKLFLSGGTSRLAGIVDMMTGVLDINTFVHDPFRKVRVPRKLDDETLRSVAPCLNVATGLAGRTGG